MNVWHAMKVLDLVAWVVAWAILAVSLEGMTGNPNSWRIAGVIMFCTGAYIKCSIQCDRVCERIKRE